MPWSPPIAQTGYKHRLPTVCAGFTTNLPQVVEVSRAHVHRSKGSLQAFCGKDTPTEQIVAAIEILECEGARARTYTLTSKKEGGGQE